MSESPLTPTEIANIDLRERARAEADRHTENLKGAIALAGQTLRSLEILNGGAAIGILTFYGHVLSKDGAPVQVDICAIRIALILFGIGLLAACVASGLAWYSQLSAATKQQNEKVVRVVAVCFVVLSGALFLGGVIAAAVSFG